MIIWFTGQPGAGKSTLAGALQAALRAHGHRVEAIDGEELRRQTGNDDYSDAGRILNVRNAQRRATELAADGSAVIASFVSPHRSLREELKKNQDVLEIYVHTSKANPKDIYRVPYYEPPTSGYLDLDTSAHTVEQCVAKIMVALSHREA